MKKWITSLAVAAMPAMLLAQDPQIYTINGTIKGLRENNKAILLRMSGGRMTFDTVDVVKGMFTLTGTVSSPQRSFLYLTHDGTVPQNISQGDRTPVYLQSGTILVQSKDSLKNAVLSGTSFNEDQHQFTQLLMPFEAREAALQKSYAKANEGGDTLESSIVRMQYEAFKVERDKAMEKYVLSHPASMVSLYVLRVYFDPSIDHAKTAALYDQLSASLQESTAGMQFARLLQRAKVLDVGSIAPEFTVPDTAGVQVSLQSFRGKYVLVDFWASWCLPCRKENPNVIQAFNHFKDKNFTVLGFSLDDGEKSKSLWLDAIKKDGLTWTQLSDLSGWNSPVAMMYNLKAIPANFLLDPTGKIIARNLRGKELEDKLAEVLGKI